MKERKTQKSPTSFQMWEKAAPGEDGGVGMFSAMADLREMDLVTPHRLSHYKVLSPWLSPSRKGQQREEGMILPGMGDAWRLQTGNTCPPKHCPSFKLARSIAVPTQLPGVGRGLALNAKTCLIPASSKDTLQVKEKAKQQQFPPSSCQKKRSASSLCRMVTLGKLSG